MFITDRRVLSVVILLLVAAGLLIPSTGYAEVIKLSSMEVKSIVDMGAETYNYMIIDIRDETSYGSGHIPGAVNIPGKDIEAKIKAIPKDKNIIIYCSTGGKSTEACKKLMALGYMQVYATSFDEWKKSGYTVEKT